MNDIHINWEQGNVQGYSKEWDCKDDLKLKNAPLIKSMAYLMISQRKKISLQLQGIMNKEK